jgi:hypothetical protein
VLDTDELELSLGEDVPAAPAKRPRPSARVRRRRALAGLIAVAALVGGALLTRDDASLPPLKPKEVPGTSAWARAHYGRPDAKSFRQRHIVQIEFLGTTMFVHEKTIPHFYRLERIFEARAPEYAAAVATGTPDDWSYGNRDIRGSASKSNHAFGIAIDVNALTNVLGTSGDMPMEVVEQWEIEGGGWGGRWSRPDPMHFETHLTPAEIAERYNPDGTPQDWYLEELTGG